MGTINYRSGDVITLGIEPLNYDDYRFEEDEDEINYEAMNSDEAFLKEEVKEIIGKYNFYYSGIQVIVESGYYEGFYIAIDNPFKESTYWWDEKRDAQKEITQLKKLLIELTEYGLVEVWPGWCTSYKSKEETLAKIPEIIRELRKSCREAEVWNYNKSHRAA